MKLVSPRMLRSEGKTVTGSDLAASAVTQSLEAAGIGVRLPQSVENIADRAAGYGIPGKVVDGMDVKAVYRDAGEAVERARAGDGPTLLECKTYRYMGHSRFEKAVYRTKDELEEWKKRDPVKLFKEYLLKEMKIEEKELGRIDSEIDKEIDDSIEFSENSPDPDPDDYKKYIYA